MLRKRNRSHHKDQHMNHLISDSISDSYFHSDISTQKQKTNSFVKITSDTDSVRSPTSPLDFRIFSSFGNPFRNPRSQNEGLLKSWNRDKVGLSIIDSLDDETKGPAKVVRSSDKKHVLFEKSENADNGSSDVLFEIGKNPFEAGPKNEDIGAPSVDSVYYGSYSTGFGEILDVERASYIGYVPVSKIEHCEDYTCVRTHGPNPKVTHILGDRVLECHDDEVTVLLEKIEDDRRIIEAGGPSDVLASYPSNSFLKFCYSCKKDLDGEDIYMYRGEKAFCSYTCRSQEIENEEEMEKTDHDSSGFFDESSNSSEVTSKSGLFIAT